MALAERGAEAVEARPLLGAAVGAAAGWREPAEVPNCKALCIQTPGICV